MKNSRRSQHQLQRVIHLGVSLCVLGLLSLSGSLSVQGLEESLSSTSQAADTIVEDRSATSESSSQVDSSRSMISSTHADLTNASSESSSSSSSINTSASQSETLSGSIDGKTVENSPASKQSAVTEPKSDKISGEASPLYRLYHTGLRVHLYTRDQNEYNVLGSNGWNQEGIAWQTAVQQGEIVYRLYHPGLRVHLYTKDVNEYQTLAVRGWRQEGEAYRSYGSIPVYRLYHPGLQRHLYTYDENEYKVLGSRGWKQEGIAFYGIGAGIGNTSPVVSTPPSMPTVSGKLSVQVGANGQFDVKITDVQPKEQISAVKVAIWSEVGGQDDIAWYTANRAANGDYQLTVHAQNHGYQYGAYQVHLYYELPAKQMVGIQQARVILPEGPAAGKLSISSGNQDELSFDAIVSDIVAPSGLEEVAVAVWSEAGGQDDLKWYTASKQSDGQYRVHVNVADHHYSFGTYHIHAYLTSKSKKAVNIATATTVVAQPSQSVTIASSYLGTGNYRLQFNGVFADKQLRFAVWSEVNGQDDLKWYEASRKDAATFVGQFNAQQHSHTGNYQVHLYAVVNGQMKGLASTTIHVPKADFSAPYYSQRDSRWGGRVYGLWRFNDSGCVPTAMAMIISGLKGEGVSPVTVGEHLYHQTLEFNRGYFGTSSRGIALAAKNWGLKTNVLNSQIELTRALQDGYYVAAAVGPGRFVLNSTHELVLKGYKNGNTYVMDPYNPNNNGWYSIDYLWAIQSKDSIDLTEGRPFLKITD
ncbi:hypothetical protein GGG87_07600 [Streptococcus sp. zg-86]|uniref:Uncharacterized protein n=1 Tax=Streptococcus zhangguiae TaxID=2664091 RepID=A0A6I4RHF4_9STRE|nr:MULTISPECIES: GBS Bsp-like repeat-containing protein [unclassified Streptococcus]MTB64857.1 hypothetical protein [Streptococcus sp. zg-86]MTB91073.1 hypothetical protein [Streptococcus sp. zg-36]MWV56844.1 hypothetical protein [Streptococcus sp. zg-70]QTH48350.1 GBS Bsp-like repeat-containing protein [Streptococcus sp. zg-86]